MQSSFSESFKNNFEAFTAFAGKVAAFHEEAEIPAHIAYAVDLALEELTTNIIKYSFDDDLEHEISVHIERSSSSITIRIVDDGHEFNPVTASEPDTSAPLEERKIGGLGLMLVRNNFPRFTYHRENNLNTIELGIDL